jgi:IclR family transcriptional regulator, KDG regulon repressor
MSTSVNERDDRAAVDKAISLLISFGDQTASGLGVSELARRADLSKSTAFRVLGMLVRNGVVERVGSSYRLGARLHDLGTAVYSTEHEKIHEVLTPYLADLYEMTHQTVHLAALHGVEVVYLAKLFGHRRVPSPSRVGGRVPAHCTALGKVLMAYSPDAFDEMLASPLDKLTSRSLTDVDALSAQLMRIRREGIAFDDQEAADGLSCVAVPLLGAGGRPVAAMSLSGPSAEYDPRTQVSTIRRVAHAASQALVRAGVGATVRLPRAIA